MSTPVNTTKHQGCIIDLHYLPCIAYLQLFFEYHEVHIERHENYQKGGYRNRAYLSSPQGRQMLSVPLLKGKHQQTLITDVQIAYHMPWYAQHWHAIRTSYGKAPFFIHYSEDIREILYRKYEKLYALNMAFLQWFTHMLQAPASLSETEQYISEYGQTTDLRDTIKPSMDLLTAPYEQVFTDRLGFLSNLSALDLLMHLGPDAYGYLSGLKPQDVK